MKKRLIAPLCLALSLAVALAGCSIMDESADDPIYVMASFYPLYALAVNVTEDVPSLTLGCLVQPQDGCPRTYALSNWDAAVIAQQDAFIIAGRGFESFETALNSATDGPALLTLLEGRTLRDNGVAVNEESAHTDGPNPWLFMSVPGAIEMTLSLGHGLAQLDERYAGDYIENMNGFIMRLELLAGEISSLMAGAPKLPVACLHEGLSYFAEECGLTVSADLSREPGSEPVDNDLEALMNDLAASDARVVLIEKQAPESLESALVQAGYAVARLDTLMTHQADGDTEAYERIMLENARALKDALTAANAADR